MKKGLTAREQARKTTRANRRMRTSDLIKSQAIANRETIDYPEVFRTTILPAARADGAPTNRSW